MRYSALGIGLAMGLAALGGCSESENVANTAQPSQAREAAGDKTIAAGLSQDGKFVAAAKAAGLDQTLAGPGPYTVLVPDDAAFGKLPAGLYDTWLKPESRAQLTAVLTYHILPGTVLAADITKAIDNAKGKALLATMGGGTLTAAREGDTIVLTDAAGGRAVITKADEQFSNGVVHHIDAVLAPAK